MSLLLVPHIYRLRHKILGILFKKIYGRSVNSTIQAEAYAVPISEVAKTLKVNEEHVYSACYGMDETDLIFVDYGVGNSIFLGPTLINSYNTRKYLNLGKKQRIDSIKDYLYIIVSAIAIISTISSLLLYVITVNALQTNVSKLRLELQELKKQEHSPDKKKPENSPASFLIK